MIKTLTKLFVTNIVANNRSESPSNRLIIGSEICMSSSIEFKSVGDKEKKAISDAEANPDTINMKDAINNAIQSLIAGVVTFI